MSEVVFHGGVRRCLGDCELGAVLGAREVIGINGTFATSNFIEAAMVRDPEQPGQQAAFATKSLKPLKCLEEYLLANLLSGLWIPQHLGAVSMDSGAVTLHK
jgi:hypothetical protein